MFLHFLAYENASSNILKKRVNSCGVARWCIKNTANTLIFPTSGTRHRKYRGFWFPRRQERWYLHDFTCIYGVLCSESLRKSENTTFLPIFRGTPKCDKKMCALRWLPAECKEYHTVLCAKHMNNTNTHTNYKNLKPKGRGTKTSGGVRHGDSYKKYNYRYRCLYLNIYIYVCVC